MPIIDRLYRQPPFVDGSSMASSWLGMLTSWAALGFGAAAGVRAAGLLLAVRAGACGGADVCEVSGWGGLALGTAALIAAPVLWMLVARGFGPPVTWWVLPVAISAAAFVPSAAPGVLARPGLLVASGFCTIAAVLAGAGAARQGRWALLGWVRLDGLDAREVPHRRIDRLVAPAALVAAAAGAAFGSHTIATLASG